jgi:hypothetical protein
METVESSSETLVSFHMTTWRHIPEEHDLNIVFFVQFVALFKSWHIFILFINHCTI